MNSLHWFSIIW